MKVIFLHPDLGIGGAERLIVDAALGLKQKGHSVCIITSHHDENHCFEETKNGQIEVRVVGDWIPRSIFQRFYALMAYIRMIYAAFYIIFSSDLKPDVIICDLVSVAIPILKLKYENIIFYCHYPDCLLSKPGGCLKATYRKLLDWLEETSTGKASRIFVNSNFTAGVFKDTFKNLTIKPDVLYPSLNTEFFDKTKEESFNSVVPNTVSKDSIVFLSINRYERKKNLSLAIHSFNELKTIIDLNVWKNVHLIIAGGYDPRVTENIEYHNELVELSSRLDLKDKITFLKSPDDSKKLTLLKNCTCLIYTPSFEHFGIVPIEAMYVRKPVIAVNNGGPTETIKNESTGFLCDASPKDFASAMSKFANDKQLALKYGEAGRKRVIELFSFEKFSSKLDQVVNELVDKKKN